MADLLVSGYIGEIEEMINEQIIPQTIIQLCLKFYHSSLPIYYLSEMKHENYNGLYIADINHHQRFTINIYKSSNWSKQITTDDLMLDNTGICVANNITLPSSIKEKLITSYEYHDYDFNHSRATFNVIFRCTQYQTIATIIECQQFQDFTTEGLNSVYNLSIFCYSQNCIKQSVSDLIGNYLHYITGIHIYYILINMD